VSDKPPFDAVRACFWLIASILAVECLVVVAGVGMCLYYADIIIKDPAIVCDPKDRLASLLTGALAAALAFAGGFTRKPPKE
jgi:hypothetical protein